MRNLAVILSFAAVMFCGCGTNAGHDDHGSVGGVDHGTQKLEAEKPQDSFVALRDLIRRTLAGNSDCGLISTNRSRYFEVKPQPRGLTVTVSELPFYTQTEWDKRYTSGTNLMSQFIQLARTNHPMDVKIDAKTMEWIEGVSNAFGLFDLPSWHYQNIGVDVEIEELEYVYPGLKQDRAEAQKRYRKIVALLEPYQRTNIRHNPHGGF